MTEPSNQPLPPIAAAAPALPYMAAHPLYRGRRGGLIGWGIVLIVLGGFAAFFAAMVPAMILMMLWSMPAGSGGGGIDRDLRGLILPELMYLGVAIVLIWTGIGSVRIRRWSRPLIIIIGWTWLLAGLLMVAVMLFSLAQIGGIPWGALLVIALVFALLLVVLPGAMLLFYHRRDVRETFDAFDPHPAWTDRCPASVLGLSLGMWFAAASALAGLIYCVTPFFGIYLTGIPAAAALVATAGLFAWAGWASYLLRPAGWWLSLALSVLLPVSGILSFAREGAGAMYRHMGLSGFQIEAMSARDASQAVVQVVMMGLVSAAAIGYMLWIRRHFFPRAG